MARVLKRPMFRRGGSTNDGIMSGPEDREKFATQGTILDVDRARLIELVSEELGVPVRDVEMMEDVDIIFCDECELESIYKSGGLFLCANCLTKYNKKEVKNES